MLKVWIIQIGEPLLIIGDERKMRSNLLAEELARRGHEVVLWVSAFDHNAKKWAIKSDGDLVQRENIKVNLLKGTGYKKNISLARYLDHRVMAWKFRKQAKAQDKPDVIVASLPPHDLAYQCVKYAGANWVPVVVDIRDLWPDIIVDSLPERLSFLGRMLLFNDFRMVKKAMSKADGLTAVSNSFLEWGLRCGNRQRSEADRVFYLGYHRLEAGAGMDNLRAEFREVLEKLDNRQVVTYIGTFSESQGPTVMTECAKRFGNSDIAFVFTGYGDLYERARIEFKESKNVFFVGWLNQNEIDALLMKSSIGICPYSKNSTIFPNKACMYLSAGLPVASSYQGDLKDLIEIEKIGINMGTADPDSLADFVRFLIGDRRAYMDMSHKAQAVFESYFLEDKLYVGFADMLEQIAEAKGPKWSLDTI